MGLGQSIPSECEDNVVHEIDDETNALNEKSMAPNSYRQNGNVKSDQIPTPEQEIVEQFQKLQIDNIIEERNHSERIIRAKEKLLKEKEETIRQQANLIKTQSELLEQRKHRRNMPNVSSVRVHYDVGCKPRTKPTQYAKSVSHSENVHSNGQYRRSRVLTDSDFVKKYVNDRKPVQRSDQSTQMYKTTSVVLNNNFTYGIPFHRDSRSSNSKYYLSNSDYDVNVPSPNPDGLDSKPIVSMHTRRSQYNEYRTSNSKSDELRDYDVKQQSTSQLLADLEKQTNYEIQRLDHVQNGVKLQTQVDSVKCPGCRVARKSKVASTGFPQKCKKCGSSVSRTMKRNCKSDDEGRNQSLWTSDTELISDVD